MHRRHDFREFLAAAKFDADTAIAREPSSASQDEVPQSSQTRHSFSAASACDDEPGHFRETSSDQRGYGVVAQSEPVTDPGCDRDGVLKRAAEFHADNVVVGVDTKRTVAEFLLNTAEQVGTGRCDGDGSG